jgi:hypothetical protein
MQRLSPRCPGPPRVSDASKSAWGAEHQEQAQLCTRTDGRERGCGLYPSALDLMVNALRVTPVSHRV